MPQTIPLQSVPSQVLSVILNSQQCQLKVYQKSTGLYIDVYLNGSLLKGGQICQNENRIIRDAYYGFVGDMAFVDSQGSNDPDYTGLGGRFTLNYFDPDEVTQALAQ